jgi:Predicted multitransmembrane protein
MTAKTKKISDFFFSKSNAPTTLSAFLFILLLFLPTGFEEAIQYKDQIQAKVRIISTDESRIISTGLIRSGEQQCSVEILNGELKGETGEGSNFLNGSLESDKIFMPGDTALAMVAQTDGRIRSINLIDHYRIDKQLLLVAFFIVLIILFAGKTGIRALLSFSITILTLWKVLIPSYLRGINPIFAGIGIVTLLIILCISLVYGFDRRWLCATLGSLGGILSTVIFAAIFTDLFKIHGAVMPNSESLLYSGYQTLNLTRIFVAGTIIGASGAFIDLSVDISSAIAEVVAKKPTISRREAIKSGLTIGRAAAGTMTTTLLLAYSGSYISLLMVFMAQGTPLINILNFKYVSADILDTIIGSIGIILVAPLTALAGGILLTKNMREL